MPRVNLKVAFSEKDDAKAIGAKWDPNQKVWYIPDGVDPKPFDKWLEPLEGGEPSVHAKSYYIAEASRECWKCKKESCVYAFLLPSGFEALYVDDDPKDDRWDIYTQPSILTYVTNLPEHAQHAMQSITKMYFKDFSRTTQTQYWVNHCEHCRALLGDFETLEEFDSPFRPHDPNQACKIFLRFFNKAFESDGGYSDYDDSMQFFEYMRKT